MSESFPNNPGAIPADIGGGHGTALTFGRLLDLLREHLRTGRSAFCDRCLSEIVFTPDERSRFSSRCPCGLCNAEGL